MCSPLKRVAAIAAAAALSGCAALPPERGYADTHALVDERRGSSSAWADPFDSGVTPVAPVAPIDTAQAVRLAFLYNPRMRQAYARIGLGRAELESARRIANPELSYTRLTAAGGTQITRSLSVRFSEVLFLGARKRLAAAELDRLQSQLAAQLIDLAAEVETAWYGSVAADQVATMRDTVAQAGEASALLAQRYFDAGNISRLQLEQELAAASQARIDAVRARSEALRARSHLAALVGLPSDATWTTRPGLPMPPAEQPAFDALLAIALDARLDVDALSKEVALSEQSFARTRRWRWLGAVGVGYEREREIDGALLRGPSVALELPIFDQGQAAIARTQARLQDARARRDAALLGVRNDVRLGIDRLALAWDIVERYRSLLLPQREAIVARSQEQLNFMLIGVFELIHARQSEYAAYQAYMESIRDYWTARSELRRLAGGRLPDDGKPEHLADDPGIGAIQHDHASSGAHEHAAPIDDVPAADEDPHAGHAIVPPVDHDAPGELGREAPARPQGDTP